MNSEKDKNVAVDGFRAAIIEALWGDEIRDMAKIKKEIRRIKDEEDFRKAELNRAVAFVKR